MSRSVVITGMGAVTPLGIGARTLYERWLARPERDRGRQGRRVGVRSHRPPLDQGGAPRRPLLAVRDRRGRRGAGRGRLGDERREAVRLRPHRLRDRHRHRRHRDARARQGAADRVGAEEGPAAVRAADDEQRRLRHAVAALRPARQLVRHGLGLLGRRARDRHLRPPDPGRRRRRGRHRRLRGRADAAVVGRVRGARRAVGHRHLAPVRRPPRRLRHGRGRRA